MPLLNSKLVKKNSKDSSEIVDAFNNFVTNIGSNLAQKKLTPPPNVDHTLYFKYINHQPVLLAN